MSNSNFYQQSDILSSSQVLSLLSFHASLPSVSPFLRLISLPCCRHMVECIFIEINIVLVFLRPQDSFSSLYTTARKFSSLPWELGDSGDCVSLPEPSAPHVGSSGSDSSRALALQSC